jgi:hypothetical protein
MLTPVVAYSAAGTPIGPAGGLPLLVQFYRPPTVLDASGLAYVASVVPFGGGTLAVGGLIAIMEMGLELTGKTSMTTGRYGESADDPTILRETPKLNLGTYVQGAGQPTLAIGDFIEIIVGRPITSSVATPVAMKAGRWVIDGNSLSTAGFNKFALKLTFDRVNSDPAFNLF